MNKKIVGLIILAIAIGGGVKFYTAPMSTLEEIRDGFANKKAELISSHVDYDTLRKNIKEKMLLKIAKENNTEKDGMAMLGSMMGASIVDNLLNTYVTPSGLKMAMEKSNKKIDAFKEVTYDGVFKDLNTFEIVLHKKDKDDVHGKMKRMGLFEWKVIDIDMPDKK